jgi:hypothetical protein
MEGTMASKSKEQKPSDGPSILEKVKSMFVEEVDQEESRSEESTSEGLVATGSASQMDLTGGEVDFERIFSQAQILDPNEFSSPGHVQSLMATFSQLPESQRKDMVLKTLKTFKVDPSVVVNNTLKRISAAGTYLSDVQQQVTETIDKENRTIEDLESQIDGHKNSIQQAQSLLDSASKIVGQKVEELQAVVDFLGGQSKK